MSKAESRWKRERAGVYRFGDYEIRRYSHWWAICGDPYPLYLTLRDAKREVEARCAN